MRRIEIIADQYEVRVSTPTIEQIQKFGGPVHKKYIEAYPEATDEFKLLEVDGEGTVLYYDEFTEFVLEIMAVESVRDYLESHGL